MLRATLNEAIPLQVQVNNGQTDLYGRVKVYNSAGALHASLSLVHIDNGLYGTDYTFTAAGYYTAVYQLYEDAGFTKISDFDIEAEGIEANEDKTNILRILGLNHENSVVDNNVYNAGGNIISSRIRHYDTKTNALVAGAAGLLDTWTVSATYDGNKLLTYTVVRE